MKLTFQIACGIVLGYIGINVVNYLAVFVVLTYRLF
jgi:hypothetical protein